MIGWATAHKKARIALDVGKDAVHFTNPHLPLTRSELALPILLGSEVLGALTIQSQRPEAFDEDDITILQGIADSLATAINNAKLFTQVQQNLEEISALHHSYLSEAWSDVSIPSEGLSLAIEHESEQDPSAEITTLNVPLTLREEVIGNLTLEANKSNWSPEETAFIEAVTNQAALAMENARLLEETKRRVERERVVSEVTRKLWGTGDIENLLRSSLREIGRLMNASEGIIQLEINE